MQRKGTGPAIDRIDRSAQRQQRPARAFVDHAGPAKLPRETFELRQIGPEPAQQQRDVLFVQRDYQRRVERAQIAFLVSFDQHQRLAGLRQNRVRHRCAPA